MALFTVKTNAGPLGLWDWFSIRVLHRARLGKPPEEWQADSTKDAIMILHYCQITRLYYWNRHFELLSQSEGFRCGGCGQSYSTRMIPGYTSGGFPFLWHECAKIAYPEPEKRTVKSSLSERKRLRMDRKARPPKKRVRAEAPTRTWKQHLLFWRLVGGGILNHLPEHRDGKTSGELVTRANWCFIFGFARVMERMTAQQQRMNFGN